MGERKEIKNVIAVDDEKVELRREQLVGEIQERERIPRKEAEKLLRRRETTDGKAGVNDEAGDERGSS